MAIHKTYSQAGQDLFIMNVLGYLSNGYFIDIGCNDPQIYSNTRLLEDYNWNGIAFDQYEINNFSKHRKCNFILGDATQHDYNYIFKSYNVPSLIDYLSIDIDIMSLDVLEKLPLSEYECKTITIEHDWYQYGDTLRANQRQKLSNLGYLLLCSDVGGEKPDGSLVYFEDWWINPKYINPDKLKHIQLDKTLFLDILQKLYV